MSQANEVHGVLLWVAAKDSPRCCSDCGRMAQVFRSPMTLRQGLEKALALKMGERDVLQERIADMCASGLLVVFACDD